METRKRSILKAAVWNVLGLAIMAGVGFLMTGSVSTGGSIAIVNSVLGFSMYLIYERVWARVAWGRDV